MDPYGRPPPHRPPRPPPGQHFMARPQRPPPPSHHNMPHPMPPPPPHAAENNKSNVGYDHDESYALSAAYDNVKRVMMAPYHGSTNPDRMEEKDLEDFKFILQMIMQECSRTNIESGKTWIFKHCCEPQHMEVIADLWLALSQSRNLFMERLHLIYLVNDILFHSDRRQLQWMKDAILPRLVPLLRDAYHYNGVSNEMRGKVMKVISIWSDKQFFDSNTIESIKENVLVPPPPPPSQLTPYDINPALLQSSPPLRPNMVPPPPMPAPHFNPGFRPPFPPPPPGSYPYPPRPPMRPPPPPSMVPGVPPPPPGVMNPHLPPRPPMMNMHPRAPPPPSIIPPQYNAPTIGDPNIKQQELPPAPVSPPPVPEKQYYELPAGLMVPVVEKNDEPAYTELDPTRIQLPPPNSTPLDDLNKAVDEFYEGLDLKEQTADGGFEEQTESKLDRGGWEPGYLDTYYDSLKQKRRGKTAPRRRHEESSRSPSSRGKRRDHGRQHSRDRSRSRSRSRSPDERGRSKERRYSRSHGYRHHRSRSRSSYSRSRSRDSYRSSRSRSPSPYRPSMPRYEAHHKYRSRSRSRSPPPPSTYHQGGWYGPGGSASRYGPRPGLGGMPSDDHTTGRFMGRNDSYQNQKVCYNCSKPGHFARDCPESSYNSHRQRY